MSNEDFRRERISRILDIVIAGFALVVLSPLMLLIAAAIIVETGRPVFFAQTRLGQGGRGFRMFKFRKFASRIESSGPLITIRNDPRMSRVGRLLERTKLDELPQFYNIIKGDMAIVGPRPDTAIASEFLSGEYRILLYYKPGIFGPAQVALRNAGTLYPAYVDRHEFYREKIFPLKAALDLNYYPQRTLSKDLVWMLRGFLAVIGLHPMLKQLPALPPASRTGRASVRDKSARSGHRSARAA